MSSNRPVIVITQGDPAGVGPEVTGKALADSAVKKLADYIVIGENDRNIKKGRASKLSGEISVRNIRKAVRALNAISGPKALVTAPINKYCLGMAGYPYTGHTELLKDMTASKNAVMMFSADKLKVAIVTRHIPLNKVSKNIDLAGIRSTISLFHKALKKGFGIRNPRIGVSGINPHAGDSGTIGDEERRIIKPAVDVIRKRIRRVTGPIPADVLMRQVYSGLFDGAVFMYHDQALTAFKMLYFDTGVNITLGLPFVRTSPDHGTAFDIAGKGKADASSMVNAIKLAVKLIK